MDNVHGSFYFDHVLIKTKVKVTSTHVQQKVLQVPNKLVKRNTRENPDEMRVGSSKQLFVAICS
jgi:hypothetical protein